MIAPPKVEPGQLAIYTLSVSPDLSRVIIVSRDANVRGCDPSRWQPEIDNQYTREELQSLGEVIACQELSDGVSIGLTNAAVMDRWDRLIKSHAEHPVFRWPESTVAVSKEHSDNHVE